MHHRDHQVHPDHHPLRRTRRGFTLAVVLFATLESVAASGCEGWKGQLVDDWAGATQTPARTELEQTYLVSVTNASCKQVWGFDEPTRNPVLMWDEAGGSRGFHAVTGYQPGPAGSRKYAVLARSWGEGNCYADIVVA